MGKIAPVVRLMLAYACTPYTLDSIPTIKSLAGFPDWFVKKFNSRTRNHEAKPTARCPKAVRRYSRQEDKIAIKFAGTDSFATARLIVTSKYKYAELSDLISSNNTIALIDQHVLYIGTLKAAISFLLARSSSVFKVKHPTSQIDASQTRFNFDSIDFKANRQKSKIFLTRLEFGENFQSTKVNFYLPVTTDIGLSFA